MGDKIEMEVVVNTKAALKALQNVEGFVEKLNAKSIGSSIGSLATGSKFGGAIGGAVGLVAQYAVNAIPGLNQVGNLSRDAFMSASSGVYGRADAIGNAYERTVNAIGRAGKYLSDEEARNVYKHFRDLETGRSDDIVALKAKLAPEVLSDLTGNAGLKDPLKMFDPVLLDIYNLLKETIAWWTGENTKLQDPATKPMGK